MSWKTIEKQDSLLASLMRPKPAEPRLSDLLAEALDLVRQAETTIAGQRARISMLEKLAMRDELTGTLNRRGFRDLFEREVARAKRGSQGGLMMVFDLDGFKPVNDQHGHLAGDAALRAFAQGLGRAIRGSDAAGRLGGDEFAVLLPDVAPPARRILPLKVAGRMAGLGLDWQGQRILLQASFGVAEFAADSEFEQVLAAADADLYARKRSRKSS